MKQKYRFVGTTTEIGEHRLTKFGQEIELVDPLDAPLVTEANFKSAGFTEQEISIYAYPAQRIDAPEAFTKKLKAVQSLIGKSNPPVTVAPVKEGN